MLSDVSSVSTKYRLLTGAVFNRVQVFFCLCTCCRSTSLEVNGCRFRYDYETVYRFVSWRSVLVFVRINAQICDSFCCCSYLLDFWFGGADLLLLASNSSLLQVFFCQNVSVYAPDNLGFCLTTGRCTPSGFPPKSVLLYCIPRPKH